jgi:preprotein translocase subunit SecG
VTALIVLLYVIHVLVSIFLVLVVLLQQGKGADLSVFGGGSTQAAFGARGAATLLHKLTVGGFVLFTLSTLIIAVWQGSRGQSTVTRGLAATEAEQAAPPAPQPEAPAEAAPAAAPPPADSPAPAGEAGTQGAASPEAASEAPAEEPPPGSSLPDASPDSP